MIKIRLATLLFLSVFITSNSYSQITPPYFDDFEGVNAGWTVDSVSGSTWELGTPTTAPTNSAHSGVNAWDVDLVNVYLPNTECYLVSPVFDFSNSVSDVLSFWQNRDTEVGWDGARVDYSTNGGASWTVLGILNDPNATNWYNAGGLGSSGLSGWDSSSNGWIKSTYDLSLLSGLPSVMFRFAFTSDNATQWTGFTMDDFDISSPVIPALDAGVVVIVDPNASTPANTSTDVNVVIFNYGLATLTTIPVTYSVNGIVAGTATWNGTLASGDADTVTVGNFIVPSGIYQVCAYTELPGDSNLFNDTLCAMLNGISTGISVSIFDSLGFVNCVNPPVTDQFIVFGTAPTMNDGDTINLHVAYGDGTDTTLITTVTTGFFSAFLEHTYLFSGQFSLEVIAFNNVGDGDTAVNYNQLIISDTCGNITGSVYADLNGNCIFDTTDLALSGIPVHLMQSGNLIRTYYSNPDGSYFFVVASATAYDLMIDTNYAGVTAYCPATGTITGVTEPSTGNDFGMDGGAGYDLEPNLNPFLIGLNQGSNWIWLNLANNFFLPVNGDLKLVIDTNLLNIVSIAPVPDAISGDTIIWNAVNLTSNSYHFSASLGVAPGASLVIGDSVCLTVIADPVAGDSVPGNNVKTVCGVVVNSYDPNNKTVEPAGDFTDPDGLFTSTINFQNTGTAPAFNVFLLDTIDSNLDINTLQVIAGSHFYSTTIVDPSVVKFSFNNILLPDSGSDEPGSHGYITYTIAPKPGLTNGTQITNTASIYFDFNPAIVTNTTTNNVDYPSGINEILSNNSMVVYPNPASDMIQIISAKADGELFVYDVYGKLVSSAKMNSRHMELQVKNWKSGVYFITLKTKDSTVTQRLVVIK